MYSIFFIQPSSVKLEPWRAWGRRAPHSLTPIQRRTMYRHQEATGRKQPAWGGTDSWEEEVIEGDPCPLTVHRERSHSPKRYTTMLIPEVQTHVHKREKKTRSACSHGPAPCLVSLSGRKAHILKTWQGSQGVSGRRDQDFGKASLPVAGSSAREVELGRTGLSAMPGFEKKTRFDTFHGFPSCESAPHSAQMRMYRLKMSSLEDCSCFREGCLQSPSSPFTPPLMSNCYL